MCCYISWIKMYIMSGILDITKRGFYSVKIINIADPASELIEIYHSLNETQLRHYYEPVKEGLFIAETPVVIERALEAGYEPVTVSGLFGYDPPPTSDEVFIYDPTTYKYPETPKDYIQE